MKNTFYLFLVIAFVLTACDTDTDPLPRTGDDRNKFVGTWLCTDISTVFGTSTFTVEISRVGSNDSIEIKNWYNLGMNTEAIALIADNSIIIPNQDITGIFITGSGFYNNSKSEITVTYSADDGSMVDQIVSTCKK